MRDPQRPDRPSSEDTLPPLNLSIPSTIARLKKEATAEREISDQLSNHSDRLEEKANEAQSKEEELDRQANLLRDEIISLDQSRIPDLISEINNICPCNICPSFSIMEYLSKYLLYFPDIFFYSRFFGRLMFLKQIFLESKICFSPKNFDTKFGCTHIFGLKIF